MNFVICGRGGQGVITLNALLGNLASRLGFDAISSETHGMAMRGGSVFTALKTGRALSAAMGLGEADVIISTEEKEVTANCRFLKKGGLVITDGGNSLDIPFEIEAVEARKTAENRFGGSLQAAVILLGRTIARFPEIFPPEKSAEILRKNKKISEEALLFGLGRNP